jgi:hypothetical protein
LKESRKHSCLDAMKSRKESSRKPGAFHQRDFAFPED